MRKSERRKRMIMQKLLGLIVLILSVVIFVIAINGETVEQRDGTVLFFMIPMGLGLLFSKNLIIL